VPVPETETDVVTLDVINCKREIDDYDSHSYCNKLRWGIDPS